MNHTISRRELYAHGEPFGNSATRKKLGGGYVCGFGGDSSSASTSQTFNTDKRLALQDSIGTSGDNSAINYTSTTQNNITDGGIVSRALDSIDVNNATNAQGFQSLLQAANFNTSTQANAFADLLDSASKNLFQSGERLIGQTQQSVADAYGKAQTEAKGTIDNKTIIVLAVAGAAALAFSRRKG